MSPLIDLLERKFGRLTVVGFEGRRSSHTYWLCRCECGVEKPVCGVHLRQGLVISCGCVGSRRLGDATRKHGQSHSRVGPQSREYTVWKAIKQRCHNPNNPRYRDYGGRGVTVCLRWRRDFSAFLDDAGTSPSKAHTLDRIDNDRGYEPGNVRWMTRKSQNRNKRNTRWVTIDGKTMSLIDAAEMLNVNYITVYSRVQRGWDAVKALTHPVDTTRQPKAFS